MFRDVESAYNDAVALGDHRLVEMYARVWLWLIQTAKEDRQAMAPEHRRPPARAETHRSMTATTKAKPQRSPSSVLDHLKDTLGVREKRPVSLAHVKRNALLVDPNRWSDVPQVDDCFIKAVENSERAASAKRAADRDFYLRMERKWLGLAEGLRWIADLERRHG